MYNREELIAAVINEIENIMLQYENDDDVTDVDIRLQLVDGTYYIHTGDSQFDTDHRGAIGYGYVRTNYHIDDTYPNDAYDLYEPTEPHQYKGIAEDIVDQALEEYEQSEIQTNKILKDIEDDFAWNN